MNFEKYVKADGFEVVSIHGLDVCAKMNALRGGCYAERKSIN